MFIIPQLAWVRNLGMPQLSLLLRGGSQLESECQAGLGSHLKAQLVKHLLPHSRPRLSAGFGSWRAVGPWFLDMRVSPCGSLFHENERGEWAVERVCWQDGR